MTVIICSVTDDERSYQDPLTFEWKETKSQCRLDREELIKDHIWIILFLDSLQPCIVLTKECAGFNVISRCIILVVSTGNISLVKSRETDRS